ncbi:MAG: porphobilinogen deaminase [Betaproteobacteria bacterium SG8_40]|nr:MAG: porphobilinogen deaminase [Betaproteobacteria bacterium SG8_40]
MLSKSPKSIVIATRESALALWQARYVAALLQKRIPGLGVSLLGMTTEGDRRLEVSLARIGGKGLFVKELEQALYDGRADIAVHSMKDVPMELPPGFRIAAMIAREDPRDAFVSNRFPDLQSLPKGSVVGTSSLRRQSQIRARHPHLVVRPLRGNVQTRLRKLDEGEFAAIILAAAGLQRLSLQQRVTAFLEPEQSLPAVGQGALGIECREDRADLRELLAQLEDAQTRCCVEAERSLSRELAGSCNVPLGGYAQLIGDKMRLRGFVARPDGSKLIEDDLTLPFTDSVADTIGRDMARRLAERGAREILDSLELEG